MERPHHPVRDRDPTRSWQLTVSDTVLGTMRFAIFEYSGVVTVNSLDETAAQQGTGVSPNAGMRPQGQGRFAVCCNRSAVTLLQRFGMSLWPIAGRQPDPTSRSCRRPCRSRDSAREARGSRTRRADTRRSPADIAKSLHGNWRKELLVVLRHEVELYNVYQDKIGECDHELRTHLQTS
jgi:hypothetical protein